MSEPSKKSAQNSTLLRAFSLDLGQSKTYLNPFKRVLKTASSSKDRFTQIFKDTFSRRRASVALTVVRRLSIEEEDDYHEAPIHEIGILRTFSPLMVHRHIHVSSPAKQLEPTCWTHFGAVLFADISGFTRLANLLSVEELQRHISSYFSTLFACVEQFGGDILKICGDAIMIMWPLESNAELSTTEEKAACALTASLCGRELLLSCGTYRAYHGEEEISLSLHCGVGVADVPCYWVGRASRWEFLITGDALTQISSTEPEAKSGEIVISPETYNLIKDQLVATLTPGGNYLLTTEIVRPKLKRAAVTTTGLVRPTSPSMSSLLDPIPGLSDHPTLNFDRNREIATAFLGPYHKSDPGSLPLLTEHARMGKGLRFFVHRSARPRLVQMDRSTEFEMGELREVVTIFANLTGLDEDFRLLKFEVIQKVMIAIVESHVAFGGTLRQFVVDDKGCVAIGALGVPHHTFEDNGVRAVNIANSLRQKIQKMGKNCSIGISKGSTFCGLVGSSSRREYAMMGSSVNLAARLMGSCPLGSIIVDEHVRAAACEHLAFVDMGTIIAKGYIDPVPVFAFQDAVNDIDEEAGSKSENIGDKVVVGRKEQLITLRLAVEDFAQGVKGFERQFHFLEGEEGIGKSLVARLVTFESKKRNLRVIAVTGSESSSNTDYWLLSNIIDQVMTLHEKSKRKVSEAEKPIFKKKISSFSMTSLPATDMGSSPTSSVSSPSSKNKFSPDYTYGSCSRRDPFSCTSPEDLQKSMSSKTSRFREFVGELLMKHDDGDVVNENNQNSMSVIHGYPVMDLVYLIGDVFREEIEMTSPTVTPRMHQLLLKALITRCLQVAFQDYLTVLIADNMQWCDIPSAAALVDLIGCVESGFGVMCYRSTLISRESENKVFSTLRGMCYSVPLPPLKGPDAAELVRHVVGSEHQSAVTKEMITRILARTQGNPGLIEVLVTAFKGEADKGLNPNIEDIRTPGQQSIVQRFDALDVNLQLLLKTTAAIGNFFSVATIRNVYDLLSVSTLLPSTFGASEKERTGSIASGSVTLHHKPSCNSISIITRFSASSDMFLRDHFDGDIAKLVELGMFSVHDFQRIVPYGGSYFPRNPSNVAGSIDSPEIGIHSLLWHDARGQMRRGWMTVGFVRELKRDTHFGGGLIQRHSRPRAPVPAASASAWNVKNTFFKFSHPSVRSTAYSLSLQLDRVPVHAATIEYLSTHFGLSPGVEEACLYHAMQLKDPQEILPWLLKCTVSARDSMRHKLFTRRASQLVSILVKMDTHIGVELEEQIFVMLEQYSGSHLTGPELSHFAYSLGDRSLPVWQALDSRKSSNGSWLLSLGCVMSDLICSLVKLGEFRSVLPLYISSEKLLNILIKRPVKHSYRPASRIMEETSKTFFTQSALRSLQSAFPMEFIGSPLMALEQLSASDDVNDSNSAMLNEIEIDLENENNNDSESDFDVDIAAAYAHRTRQVPRSLMIPSLNRRPILSPTISKVFEDSSFDEVSTAQECDSPLVNPDRDVPFSVVDDISSYALQSPDLTPITEHVLTSHILAYVQAQEALALWNILRGNSSVGMLFTSDAIRVIQNTCRSECRLLHVICLPRLLALKSLCYPISESTAAASAKCLADAHLWLEKSKETVLLESVGHYHESIHPQLPGLREMHKPDTGEWVVSTVEAVTHCGQGNWTAAGECFSSAQSDLKEINDNTTLYHVNMLEAWALFSSGNLTNLHHKMIAIEQHVKQSEEALIGSSSAILLAIRFSLSCLYDVAEGVISKLSKPGTTPPTPSPSSSARSSRQTFSRTSSMRCPGMQGPSECGKNLFLRVAVAFIQSRRDPKNANVSEVTSIVGKLTERTPCTYIGGLILFFGILTGLTVYESMDSQDVCEEIGLERRSSGTGIERRSSSGGIERRPSSIGIDRRSSTIGVERRSSSSGIVRKSSSLRVGGLYRCDTTDSTGSVMHGGLAREIGAAVTSLERLSTRHTVLLYLAQAARYRLSRANGALGEGADDYHSGTTSISPSHPAHTLPLGIAYLKMELALSFSTTNKTAFALKLAEQSLEIFFLFEAQKEVAILDDCIRSLNGLPIVSPDAEYTMS